MRRAAHVLLHQRHARAALDVEPAAVEGDALADDGQAGVRRIAPMQVDQARGLLGGAADRVDRREAVAQRLADDDLHLGSEHARLRHDGLGKLGRPEIVGGGVDEVAHQRLRLGESHRRARRRWVAGQQDARRLGLVGLAVAVEAMLREAPAQPRRAGFAVAQPVGAAGELRRCARQRPRIGQPVVADADRRHPVAGRIAGEDRDFARRAGKARGGNCRARAFAEGGGESGETVLRNDLQQARGRVGIDAQQAREVGHACTPSKS